MSNNHKLIIGKPYYSVFESRNEVYTLNGVFGSYADMEHKRTKRAQWIKIESLIPCDRKVIKTYLSASNANLKKDDK